MSQDPGIATLSEDNPGGASPSTECDVSAPNGVGEVPKDENEEKSRENEAAEDKDETENRGGAEETNNGSKDSETEKAIEAENSTEAEIPATSETSEKEAEEKDEEKEAEEPKEQSEDSPKGQSEDSPKEQSPDSPKEQSQNSPKEQFQDSPKDLSQDSKSAQEPEAPQEPEEAQKTEHSPQNGATDNSHADSHNEAQIQIKVTDEQAETKPHDEPAGPEKENANGTLSADADTRGSRNTSISNSSIVSVAGSGRKASTSRPSVDSRRPLAKVENYQIFKKSLESIGSSREASKNERLRSATERAVALLDNSASRDPHVIFEALKLACESGSSALRSQAVDLFAKLFDYAIFEDESDRVALTDLSVEVIAACFEGEGTDPDVEMQVVRALMHSILLMPTHGASLLKAVRQIYNVFIFSLSPRNQQVAQGTLTQVIGAIFGRVGEKEKERSLSEGTEASETEAASESANETSDANGTSDSNDAAQKTAKPKVSAPVTLANLEGGDSGDGQRVAEANLALEKDADLAVKDAFLIFRAMCKLSVKDLDTDNVDMRSHLVRSKLLSLHVIHTILKNNIDIFLSKHVVILLAGSDDQTCLIDAVRLYLCQALIRNAASPLAPVFELSLEIFWLLLANLRSEFKMEIPVFWEQIYFPVAEMKTSTAHQKRYLLSVMERLCNDSRCIIEFYLNYDCDSAQPNICEKLIDYLTRLSLARVEVLPAQKLAYRENKRNGISLYDVSKIANLTSSTMSSRPPEPEIYASFPLEYAMKMTSLSCSVAFLRSLHLWAQKGLSSKRMSVVKGSASLLPSRSTSRNASFVGLNSVQEPSDPDAPEQFETQKQRKKAFLEGVRQFNVKPKKGVAYFIEHGFIPSDSPRDIAVFLLECDALDKAAMGEYLGEGHDRNVAIMHEFVDQMDFRNTLFTDAMRTFLQAFRLPGESQKIDRFMLKFAERYVLGNPGVFTNADAAYVLAYSTVMLNTDQHSPQVKNRMTVDNFVANNAGIDDGKDLPRELLENIYYEIQRNEIKLQSEQHAALLAGEQAVSSGPTGFFGGRDLTREAYMHASKEMSTKTEKLVKSLGKKLRSEDANVFHAASHVHHVRSIFDTVWMSILAGLTAPFKEFDDEDVTNLCLEGIKLSIRISCMFELQYAKRSFIRALVQFQNLNNIEDIKQKNIAAIYIMLDVAVSEGNYLQKSWIDILTSISQLERLQLIAQGVDQDSIPDLSTAKLVNRSSLESSSSAPTGFFLFATKESTFQTAANKFHNQHLSAEAASLLNRTALGVAMDKVFTNSAELTGEAIQDFVEALSEVASEEIESSGQSANPRMFSLQKVVDICYYNMSRIRLEWSQLWSVMGEIFNVVGCNRNVAVSFFALDSLRQLSMRFLDIDELSHFKFQKEFLKPFEHIFINNDAYDVKDMVLECINNMMMAKADKIKSGWKAIFGVLIAAAKERKESIVTKAYKMAFTINKEYCDEVRTQDSFAELASCFTEFAKNERFQKVSLLSLEVLSKLIVQIAKYTIEQEKTITIREDGERSEYLSKLWFPILFGFYDIIMSGELEVRSKTLTQFFDILLKYGEHFEADFWDLVYHKLLAPIFGVLSNPWELKYEDEFNPSNSTSEKDKLSFWVLTTLIQALNSMVSLFTHYFKQLTPLLEEFLNLLINCVCQENDTIARTGKSCLYDFVVQNAARFDENQWDEVVRAFKTLFELTTANELFELDPLKTQRRDSDSTVNQSDSEGSSKKSSIVVKCVLQLLMIEMLLDLSVNEAFYDAIPHEQLMKFANLLLDSYQFAKAFNEDYDLRVRLWNSGVIERLPNLLKQESMSSAVFLNIMFRLYCDRDKSREKQAKAYVLVSVVPICELIVERFSGFDEVNLQKSITTWRPVIIEIFQGYVELDEDDFAQYAPNMFTLTLKLFDRGLSTDLRKGIQMFLSRVGDAFVR